MDTVRELFSQEYIARLMAISIKINGRISAGATGARKSAAKGNSLEFADFRDYAPGDDLRRVDWNSYARLDKLFLKLFNEEKQANISVFLDKSKSMDFGEPKKFAYARCIAATIAYLSVKNADKVSVYCCDSALTLSKTNMTTLNVFSELVSFLDNLKPDGNTMLCESVAQSAPLRLGQGESFIISDFFSADGYKEAVKLLQNKKQHVNIIHVLDKNEIEPMDSNALRMIDSESGEILDVFVDAAAINSYHEAFKAFQNDILAFCEKRNASYTFAPTGADIIRLFV